MTTTHKTKTDMLTEFHERFGFSINVPLNRDYILEERLKIFDEEVREFRDAVLTGNKPDILKELCDVLYVTIGFGVCYGLPVDEGFKRVHDSNMSKSPTPIPDGEAIKGPDYFKAKLDDLFNDAVPVNNATIRRG